ncbi:MAG: SusD/RagB family nutrient-binding outer rane lipoprotein [Flaviaesturariibacter sp.]|nr:SusD/RagB family nutrient-binding outer rane lipoprotein [Flaviaesturariibacter sp.]
MKNYILKFTMLSIIAVSSFSCSKKIDEVYLNPNTLVRVPTEQLLPQIISVMAANYATTPPISGGHGTMSDIRYIGQYVQNWHYSNTLSPFDQMGYINSVADIAQSIWRMHYYDIGQNNNRMIEWAMEEKKWDYAGVGKAIFAWSWLTLTDYHGDVILKDAFNTSLITFRYDTQPEVYEHVKRLCFESLALLNNTGDNASPQNLAKGDAYFYQGDVNKWKKFVYGILARVHHRYSNKAEYKADSVIHYAKLAMTSNAENAMVKFEASVVPSTNNFFSISRPNNLNGSATTNPTAIRQSGYIANLVNGLNPAVSFTGSEDPRAFYMLRLNANNTFRGLAPNKGQNALNANDRPQNFWGISQVSSTIQNGAPSNEDSIRFIFRRSAPFPIMTAAEMKFLRAEAEFRKGEKGTAWQSYGEGIRMHFDMLKTTFNAAIPAERQITDATRDAYLAKVEGTSGDLTMSKIMLQKYIAMWGHGILETWVDMRRFHYTDTWPGESTQVYAGFALPTGIDLFPDNAGKPVYRYQPRFNSEYVWNINELRRIGATDRDYHTKKIWFAE